MRPKYPALIVTASATNLLAISLPDNDNVEMSLYDIITDLVFAARLLAAAMGIYPHQAIIHVWLSTQQLSFVFVVRETSISS